MATGMGLNKAQEEKIKTIAHRKAIVFNFDTENVFFTAKMWKILLSILLFICEI